MRTLTKELKSEATSYKSELQDTQDQLQALEQVRCYEEGCRFTRTTSLCAVFPQKEGMPLSWNSTVHLNSYPQFQRIMSASKATTWVLRYVFCWVIITDADLCCWFTNVFNVFPAFQQDLRHMTKQRDEISLEAATMREESKSRAQQLDLLNQQIKRKAEERERLEEEEREKREEINEKDRVRVVLSLSWLQLHLCSKPDVTWIIRHHLISGFSGVRQQLNILP